jgi:hypothetical protein
MGAIPTKAQAWLLADFNPRATAAGLREVSVVLAETIFGQLATQTYAQNTQQERSAYELNTNLYTSLEAAKAGARQALVH